jgi:hypothetical protein
VNQKPPRVSRAVASLIHLLSSHRTSPWYQFQRVKRGRVNHRPAWAQGLGGRSGVYEIPEWDFKRALSLGVVEAIGATANEVEQLPVGTRIKVRVTDLGRAALVVADAREQRTPQPGIVAGVPFGPLPRYIAPGST